MARVGGRGARAACGVRVRRVWGLGLWGCVSVCDVRCAIGARRGVIKMSVKA